MSFFGIFSNRAQAYTEQDFWTWFQSNEVLLFNFEKNREEIFDLLGDEMHKLHPSLTFEFSSIQDGKREFIISADGDKEAFPYVGSLYSSAPSLPKWIFIKFRPRRDPMDVNYGGISVVASDVAVALTPDGEWAALTVFIPGYDDTEFGTYRTITYLLLDQALGEFDVETHVSFIETKSLPEARGKTLSLEELPSAFDRLIGRP